MVSIPGLVRLGNEVHVASDLRLVAQWRAEKPKSISLAPVKRQAPPDAETAIVKVNKTASLPASTPAPNAILCYWPREECNGKGTGHVAILFPGSQYFSYIKLQGSDGHPIGLMRRDVPGFKGVPIQPAQSPIDPSRSFDDDVKAFGPLNYAIVLPKVFTEERLRQWARAMFCQTEDGDRMPGPLSHYQLCDSETEQNGVLVRAKDRKQCASVLAQGLSQSVLLKYQEFIKQIGEQYEPRGLTNAVVEISAEVPEEDQWASQAFPFGHLDPEKLGE